MVDRLKPTKPDLPGLHRRNAATTQPRIIVVSQKWLKNLRAAIQAGPKDLIHAKSLELAQYEMLDGQVVLYESKRGSSIVDDKNRQCGIKIIEAERGRIIFQVTRGVEAKIKIDRAATSDQSPIMRAMFAEMREDRSVICNYVVGRLRSDGIMLSIPPLPALAGFPEAQLELGLFSPKSESVGAKKCLIEGEAAKRSGQGNYRHYFTIDDFQLLDASALLLAAIYYQSGWNYRG